MMTLFLIGRLSRGLFGFRMWFPWSYAYSKARMNSSRETTLA